MSAAYIATGHVRHLAAWTADRIGQEGIGSYRPICGLPDRAGTYLVWAFEVGPDANLDWLDPVAHRRWDAAMRRPVCKRCAATLADLVRLAGIEAES